MMNKFWKLVGNGKERRRELVLAGQRLGVSGRRETIGVGQRFLGKKLGSKADLNLFPRLGKENRTTGRSQWWVQKKKPEKVGTGLKRSYLGETEQKKGTMSTEALILPEPTTEHKNPEFHHPTPVYKYL